MKPGGSKSKGNNFQWLLSKQLSKWWTEGERDDIFSPTDSSGARATIRHNIGLDTKYQFGDIGISDPVGMPFIKRYSMEAKCYKQDAFSLDELLLGKGQLSKFWEQTLEDAKRSNRVPMLIAKKNYFPTILILPKKETRIIKNWTKTFPSSVEGKLLKNKVEIVLFDSFLSDMDSEIFRNL